MKNKPYDRDIDSYIGEDIEQGCLSLLIIIFILTIFSIAIVWVTI